MSKVKITGHASGSGTLTLTGPNTNSDRTITLPDSTGTVHLGVGISDSADATAITINSSENIGIGVTPETWHSGYRGFQVNALSEMCHKTTPTVHRMGNAYHDGSAYKHIITGVATQYSMEDGDHNFRTVASGSADASITWTNQLQMKADGRGLSQFTAKAWINFNGPGTVAIRDSHNVSSISDTGTGRTTVVYTNAMANVNYTCVGSCNDTNSGGFFYFADSTGNATTGQIQVATNGGVYGGSTTNEGKDSATNAIIFFGD